MFLNEHVTPKVTEWFESFKRTLKKFGARIGIGRQTQAETTVAADRDEDVSRAA